MITRYNVVAAINGTVCNNSFDTYQEATDFAHVLLEGQPPGTLTVSSAGKVLWSYDKTSPTKEN